MNPIGVQRLTNQRVNNPTCNTPEQVVSWLGALQGQDYYGVKWAIGARLPDSTDAQIEQAILEKRIVRTWLMRGTLHLVTFDDLGWMLDLIAPRMLSGQERRYQQLELDHATFKKSNDLIVHMLRDGDTLTRKEIFERFEAHGISAKGQRGVHMLQKASLDGLICQSIAIKGNNPTFFLLDASQKQNFTREEAIVKLAERYFTSRGPATVQDFAWWSSLTLTNARAGLAEIKSALVEESINGQSYWQDATTSQVSSSPDVHLLPGFDEFYLGYKDRSVVIEADYMQQVCPGNNGIFKPMIVIDGQIVGLWARTLKKKSVEITLSPFTKLTDAEIEATRPCAERYSAYIGLDLNYLP